MCGTSQSDIRDLAIILALEKPKSDHDNDNETKFNDKIKLLKELYLEQSKPKFYLMKSNKI